MAPEPPTDLAVLQPCLLSLPDDLLVEEILSRLQLSSLVACQGTCRRLNTLINSSLRLTYRKELEIAGMVDNPQTAYSVSERLTLLRDRERRWMTFDWKWRRNLRIPFLTSEAAFTLTGGVYLVGKGVEADADSLLGLYSTHLPTVSDEAVEWEEIGFGKNILYFMYSSDQDLVACVTSSPCSPSSFDISIQIYIYQHSSRSPHPLAASTVLDICTLKNRNPNDPTSRLPRIEGALCGDRLAIVLYENQAHFMGPLHLFNWKTGVKIGQVQIDSPKLGLSFLRNDLLVHGNLDHGSLDIFQIIPEGADSCLRMVVSFGLPELADGLQYETLEVASGRSSGGLYPPYRTPTYPFFCDHQRTILIVVIETEDVSYALITHRATLLDRIQKALASPRLCSIHAPTVPWEDWGPRGSRMFFLKSGVSHPSSAAGTRYISIEKGFLELLDFGRTKVAAYRARLENGPPLPTPTTEVAQMELVDSNNPTTLPEGVFKEFIFTHLPYIRSTYSHDDGTLWDKPWEGVLMDDCYVLGFREPESPLGGYRVEHLDVMHFA